MTMLMRLIRPMMPEEIRESVKCITSQELEVEFGDALIQRIPTVCLSDWVFENAKSKWM